MMRALVRSRPSHVAVAAYLALFFAMGGTAVAATYVVSSNSQLGPNTVSGANPPSGYHRNTVNGSIGSYDLHSYAVTNRKIASGAVTRSKVAANALVGAHVADNSLTGADINESTLGVVPNAAFAGNSSHLGGHGAAYFARVVPFAWRPTSAGEQTLATLNGLQIVGQCNADSTALVLNAQSAGAVSLTKISGTSATRYGARLAAGGGIAVDAPASTTGTDGQAVWAPDGGGVVTVTYRIYGSANGGQCEVFGTALAGA